ncbi:MAG TPA: hypothetical protein VF960_10110 [Chloroflexota bacterium]
MKVGKLVPVIVAVLALAVTPLVASADAGPKNRLSEADALAVVAKAETFAGNPDTHGGLVSKVASDWQAFLNSLDGTLKDAVKNLNKGQIMRVIARSNHDGSDESADSNNGKDDENKSNGGKKNENANAGNKDNEHGKGNLNKNEHGNGAAADEETSDTDTDSDTATDEDNGNGANHGKSDANKGRGQSENKGKAVGRQ